MGLSAHDRLEPEVVCEHFEIDLIAMTDLDCDTSFFAGVSSDEFSAVTVPCGSRTAIVHNDTHHPNRMRSNICHELAHCFLGHECVPPLNEDGARNHDGGIEAEANFLGGCLLIPNEAANLIVASGQAHAAHLTYGVSRSMLNWRLRVSGAHVRHQRRMRSRH